VIFNLDHEMETLHFIPNGEDPYPYAHMHLMSWSQVVIRFNSDGG
jgi:hypothetical protein